MITYHSDKQENRVYDVLPQAIEKAAKDVLDAAFKVHTALGPGLLESVYEACLAYELHQRGIQVETQVVLPVVYEGLRLETGLRLDMLVEKCLIVEIKAVDNINPIHAAQLLTYLKLADKRLGLLINFNTVHLKYGIKRIVN